MDMRTKNVDEIQNLQREWEKATEGKRTLRRAVVTRDRNDPDHYVILAFFDSYESAMTNSNLPETSEFGQKQGALIEGPIQFTDLDVIDDRA
jgi:quinol monooxygenase YgiN